jgi:hypothetical protein
VANGSKDWFSRDRAPISDGESAAEVEDEVPERSSRQAWGQTQGKLQMGLALFSVKGNYAMPVYINLVDVRGGGKELTIYFTHMTVKIVGKGLEVLAEGLRRQVIPYIQEQHKSEFEARDEAHYVQSIKVGPAAEELGSWAG